MTAPTRQCVILVGGLGTRLGELTQDCPKPLLEVQGTPFLGRLMANLLRFGFDRFVLLAGYKSEKIAAFADDFAAAHQVEITVCVEQEPAGTGGALALAKQFLDEEFILLNGDTFFDFNVLDLCVDGAAGAFDVFIALRVVPDTSRFGAVLVDPTKQITAMMEKRPEGGAGLINAGVYWMRRSVVDAISGMPVSLENDVFPGLIANGQVGGKGYRGPFIDIGVPDDLAFARNHWDQFVTRPGVFFDRDGVLNHDAGYTHRANDFRWIDGAVALVKACNDAGHYVFVVTNQAGVARGYYDEAAVQRLHDWMNAELRSHGAHIDEFQYCPHHPDGTVPAYSGPCECRKPNPGMIRRLLGRWPVDVGQSVLLGDKDSDIHAAGQMDIRGIFVVDGRLPTSADVISSGLPQTQ